MSVILNDKNVMTLVDSVSRVGGASFIRGEDEVLVYDLVPGNVILVDKVGATSKREQFEHLLQVFTAHAPDNNDIQWSQVSKATNVRPGVWFRVAAIWKALGILPLYIAAAVVGAGKQ